MCGLRQLGHAGSVVVVRGLSCPSACGIFPDQGLNTVSPTSGFLTTGPPGKSCVLFSYFVGTCFLCYISSFFFFSCCILWESWVSLVYVFSVPFKHSRFEGFPFLLYAVLMMLHYLMCWLLILLLFVCSISSVNVSVLSFMSLSLPATCLLDQILYTCERCTFLLHFFVQAESSIFGVQAEMSFPLLRVREPLHVFQAAVPKQHLQSNQGTVT